MSNYAYANNVLGQRTARSQSGTAFAAAATESFGYNAKGEVVNSAHSVESARNTAFDYDGIGNRSEATFGGVTTAYTANTLNQYTEIDPGTPVMPSYDDDGNMTSDGAGKTLVWDGENRLIEVRNASGNLIATYTYDGQSRRVKKVTTSLAPQGASSEVYLYDGWNRIATYTTQSTFALQNSLTWGRDLSGNLEGAGGVGGLLARNVGGTAWDYTYDANGNVSEVIDGSGNIAAHYEYDPFGNAVVATGSSVASNPWRFSTKPVDLESGYSYYGYRYYNPVDGRWINRDPIGINGGVNIYCYVRNSPIVDCDPLGLKCIMSLSVVYSEANDGGQRVLPPPNGPKTGRVYTGSLSASYDDGTQGSWAVMSGGYRTDSSSVNDGDDSSTPAGGFTVGTTQGGSLNGFYIDGTGRDAIMIHDAPGHVGTHGCVGINGGFSDFADDMKTTKNCCKKKSVPISISYNVSDDDAPHGDKGHGKSSPHGPPIEPDPGPTNSGIPY